MSVKEFMLILCLCSFQVCASAKCDLYEDSDINRGCHKLEVEHGIVCYTRLQDSWSRKFWEANVTCREEFHRVNVSRVTCYLSESDTTKWRWSKRTMMSTCVPDKQDESRLVVAYVTVSIVIVLLSAVTLFVVFRRRKMSGNIGPNCQNGTESRVTNRAYYYPVDNIENYSCIIDANDSEYVYIADSDIKPNNNEDSEYNTLHDNVLRKNCQNYHHIPVNSDTYAHTTSSCSNVPSGTDTYSHVHNANHGKGRSGLNTEMGNIYNKLHADDQNKLQAFDSISVDPDYDHANAHSGVPASIELDAYDQVTNNLVEDGGDYAMCHEYDDNFVSEK